jgi:hypothetical protein
MLMLKLNLPGLIELMTWTFLSINDVNSIREFALSAMHLIELMLSNIASLNWNSILYVLVQRFNSLQLLVNRSFKPLESGLSVLASTIFKTTSGFELNAVHTNS